MTSSSRARERFGTLPLGAKLALLVAVFVLFVGCLLALGWLQTEVLSGVRAYVAGEGFWSKGQKDAVHHLVRYAATHDEEDFARYRIAIDVPLGDRQAREMLEQPYPDLDVVRDGFIRAGNHPGDVPAMVWLFRRFRHVGYMAKAIAIWTAGDRYIVQIQRVGDALHDEIGSTHPSPRRVMEMLGRLDLINRSVTPVESAFSRTLGKGARRTKQLMLDVTWVAAFLVVTAGLWLAWIFLRHTHAWENRYRYLLDTASDGILVSDLASGVILEANRRMGEILGMPSGRLIGMRQTDLVPEDERKHLRLFGDGGRVRTQELHMHRADGRLVPVEVSAAVTELGRGPVVQSIVRDVTERKRAEDERTGLLGRERAARGEAERANRMKDEFLSVLSHELRTPLTPILAWARLLQRGPTTPANVTRGVQVIERNARAQAQLISELLDVSRIISGKLRLDVGPVQLAEVVDAALDSVRVAADAKGIVLQTRTAPDVGTIVGDPDRLQQVVWNLVSNAIKFTPAGGRVEVGVTRVGGVVTITVRDTGAGIEPEFLPHVFERFRQADGSSMRQHGGLGLGLAIVRHLTELHGGTVAASSTGLGNGATFTVTLPARAPVGYGGRPDAMMADTGEAPPLSDSPLEGLRVLVVDDETDTCELLATVLAASGAEVRTASSAADALDAVAHWDADVLVSDIGMPGQDGYALIRALRSQGGPRCAIPAIALTAYARAEDRRAALRAGFTHHLAKPFDPSGLVSTVASVARRA